MMYVIGEDISKKPMLPMKEQLPDISDQFWENLCECRKKHQEKTV